MSKRSPSFKARSGSLERSESLSSKKNRISRKASAKENQNEGTSKLSREFSNYIREKNKKNALSIELKDVLLFKKNVGELRKKIKILKIAQRKVEDALDISTILQKLQEIDKLKMILLNQKQRMLFNLIAKPEIHLEELKGNETAGLQISKNMKKIEEVDDQNIVDLVIYYNGLIKRISQDEEEESIDRRLVFLLDEDMKRLMET